MEVVIASPNATIDGLLKLAEAGDALLGGRTAINFPGLTVKVGSILDALESLYGHAVRARVKVEPNPEVIRIVGSWPSVIESSRAAQLGLKADIDIESIIRQFASETHMPPRLA
jgi:D-erythronate 2-dehydrogenase